MPFGPAARYSHQTVTLSSNVRQSVYVEGKHSGWSYPPLHRVTASPCAMISPLDLSQNSEQLCLSCCKPGKSTPELAAERGRYRVRMMKVAKLACLDPNIVTAIVDGRQPLKLTPSRRLATDVPLASVEQRSVLGFGRHPSTLKEVCFSGS